MSRERFSFVPNVQSFNLTGGEYTIPKKAKIHYGSIQKKPTTFLKSWLDFEETDGNGDIEFIYYSQIKSQGYKITVSDKIVVEYSEESGAFYALTTLKQLFLCDAENGCIPQLVIEDWPELSQRGLMIDVSRGRRTKIEVLKQLVDWMSELKYNQLQLYFDTIIFAYPGFERITDGQCVYSVAEIKELSEYCEERFMQLVPNQNSFGHLHRWLKIPEFSHLAITLDDGNTSGVLNPLNNQSLEFIDRLYEALLPCFRSNLINIGCDETSELGQGETKEECEKQGTGKVYFDYLMKLYSLIKEKYHSVPMFWDDIVMQHPELVPMLPKDLIVLEWGYEFDHPFEQHCKILHDSDLRFYVAPGTSAWNSICGKTENMTGNLRNAAKWAKEYGAEGFLLTDWGDGGMPQPLACSLVAYVIGGIYAWHSDSYEKDGMEKLFEEAAYYTNRFIFQTEYNLFDWIMRLGKYCNFEGVRLENRTRLWNSYEGRNPTSFPMIHCYAEELLKELSEVEAEGKYAELLIGEVENACRMLLILSDPENINGKDQIWKRKYLEHWNIRSKSEGCQYNLHLMTIFQSLVEKKKENGEKIPKATTTLKWFS